MTDTLVLDSRLLPVDVIPWTRTMRHLAASARKGHVRVVSEYADRAIKSPSREVQLPAVLQLLPGLRGDGTWTNRVVKRARCNGLRFNRRNLFARDGGRCQYCGEQVSLRAFTFDHVLPRAQGGLTSWENIVTACMACNQRKGNRTPAQAGLELLSVPAKPKQRGAQVFACFQEGMPEEWRPWLPAGSARDLRASGLYWNGRLREE